MTTLLSEDELHRLPDGERRPCAVVVVVVGRSDLALPVLTDFASRLGVLRGTFLRVGRLLDVALEEVTLFADDGTGEGVSVPTL
jgi:hypothetical protein